MPLNNNVHPNWTKRTCPICGSLKYKTKSECYANKPAEQMDWNEVKSYFIGLRNDQIFFSYFRCIDCGLLYCPWYFNNEQIANLYAVMPDNTMGEDKSTISRTQSNYARWVMKNGISNNRYLEVGPDIGLVAKEILKINPPKHVTFLEPNQSVRQELLTNVSSIKSIEIIDFLGGMQETNFDLVTGIHVYDHLINPLEDLRQLRKKVPLGGHLAIVVHNEKSVLRNFLRKKWPPFCLQHPQLFNPKTLENILRESGWGLEEVGRTTNWYHLQHFVKMGAGVLGLPAGLSRLTPNIEVPIKLGNIITLSKAI